MLICLDIKNVALIEKLNIEWKPNMTVLTGETGAGKSIIIDCVNLLLGARSDKTLIRYGSDKARIQGMFSVSQAITDRLAEEGIESEGNTVIIDRELTSEGRSLCRINGVMTTLAVLKEIGTGLVNIHGQHDNQALLNPDKHINFLDDYAKTDLNAYRELFQKRRGILSEIDSIEKDQYAREQKLDLLSYQVNEIESAELVLGEKEELLEKREVIENSEKIVKSLNEAFNALYADGCAYDMIGNASSALSKIEGIDKSIDETASRVLDVKYTIEDCVHEISEYLDNTDFDEGSLNEIEERLDTIAKLEKKYGGSVEKVLEFLSDASAELSKLQNSEETADALKAELEKTETALTKEAKKITDIRQAAAQKLQAEIEEALTQLDMPNVKFSVLLKPSDEFSANGMEACEFLICPNKGEELKPLVKIASGGELSRVMLAIKSIISDDVGTLIFDEIDTGVSGSAAQKIAKKLSRLSKKIQVICVSHSPQLAAIANNHYVIKKTSDEDRTTTHISELTTDQRILEIARIIDGSNITETAIKHAKEMLER